MKTKILFLFILFSLFLTTNFLSKDVELYINNEDADTQDTAVVVYGPGNFTLTGKIKNNLSIWEERKKIDLVFILDASGSMQDEINAVKNSIVQIIDQVNADCPDCMRVGLYVFEGGGSTAGFISKPSYCHSAGDRGAIHLTSDGQKIKNLLGQINATCSVEPWCALTIDILNDSNFGWRNQPDVVKAILVITDEPADPCGSCDSASCHGYRCAEAGNKLLSENAYFFGIVGTAMPTEVKADMDKVLNVSRKGTYYDYTRASQIPAKIIEAIRFIMGQDDFVVSRQEGPNWDNIGANFEVKNVARDGGVTTFTINLQTPQTYSQREVYFKYHLYKKDDANLYDDAWLKVIMNQPPTACITALSPTQGDVNFPVTMDASCSTDPDGDSDLVKFEWNCGNGQKFTTAKKDEQVTCLYTEKNKTYTVRLTVFDKAGQSSWYEINVITNPNKPPSNVTIDVNPPSPFMNEIATFTGSATDPDGYIVMYSWDFGDGTTLSCTDCSVVQHAYSSKSTWHVTLTVTDNDGATAQGSVDVTIANRPPSKPIITAYPTSGLAPLSVLFSITNINNIDPDGDTINCYMWDFGDGSQTIDCNSANSAITYTYASPNGIFDGRVKVMDSDGDWSEWSDPIRITTYDIEVMYDFDAKDVNLGEKTEVKAICTGSINGANLLIRIKLDQNVLYTTDTPVCDGSYHLVDYNFIEPGFYVIEAHVLNPPASCVNCSASDYIYIKRPYPPIEVPDNSQVLAVAVLLLVLMLVKKIAKN